MPPEDFSNWIPVHCAILSIFLEPQSEYADMVSAYQKKA